MRRTLLAATLLVVACRDHKPMAVHPVLSLEPTALDFGKAKAGRATALPLKLRAGSNAAVHVTALAFEGDSVFSADTTPVSIEAFGGLDLSVAITPAEVRAYSGVLVLTSDDEEHPELRVPLSGEGATPVIEVTPAAVQFPAEPADRAVEPPVSFWPAVRIASTGAVPLDVAGVTVEGAAPAAFIVLAPPPATLAPGVHADVPVKLDTLATQMAYGAELVIRSDDPARPVVRVPLSGMLRANFPPVVCANVTRVRPGDGSAPVDYADWSAAPDGGYDFSRSREVTPNAVVDLSAWSSADATTCTSDPEDQRIALTYLWEIVSAPPGPPAALTGAMLPNARLVPFATGAYELRLTVHDVQGNASAVDLRLAVAVRQDLVAQLSWVGSAGVDLDVHLVRPGSGPFAFFSEGDAGKTSGDLNGWSQLTRTPDSGFDFEWGDLGAFDDPRLNVDDTGAGALLENVSLNYPDHAPECLGAECTYQVLVHWFRDARAAGGASCTVCRDGDVCDCTGGLRCVANLAPANDAGSGPGTCREPVKPLVRVFTRGALAAVVPLDTLMPPDPFVLGAPCQLWHVADVVWPRRGADAGTVRVDVIGVSDAGVLSSPGVTRFGYRPNASGQCSPNVQRGGLGWYAPAP